MKVTSDHWLDTAIRKPTPGGAAMNTRRFLVQHFTAGASALSSVEFMQKQGLSAHLVVDRPDEDGNVNVYQMRPFNRTCAHAGSSFWRDPNTGNKFYGLNSCSIGIEIANGGDVYPTKFSKLAPVFAKHKNESTPKLWERYPEEQIAMVEAISKVLVARYNLDDLIGHEDIAPARKIDPGPAFPMARIRQACGFPPEIKK